MNDDEEKRLNDTIHDLIKEVEQLRNSVMLWKIAAAILSAISFFYACQWFRILPGWFSN